MGSYGTPDLSTGKEIESEFYKCKKCGHEYYKTWNHCPECRTPKGKGQIRPIIWILLVAVIIFAAYELIYNPINQTGIDDVASSIDLNTPNEEIKEPAELNKEIYSAEPVDFPPTGIYQLFTNNDLLAPFSIKNHTDNYSYLIKFIDTNDQSTILTIFLNKNENCKVTVPLGTYEIVTASGDVWYGSEELFGPSTDYKKFEHTYEFYKNESGYNGWIIDLKPQVDGNLKTDFITKDEFM